MSNRALEGRRLLIVEDEYLIALELLSILQHEGAAVFAPISDLNQALEVAEANFPLDAALLDINLQGKMVYAAAGKLAEQEVPLVFVTGYERADIPAFFKDAPCLTKPIDERELVAVLRTRLGEAKA